jgi:hypothetical protein
MHGETSFTEHIIVSSTDSGRYLVKSLYIFNELVPTNVKCYIPTFLLYIVQKFRNPNSYIM